MLNLKEKLEILCQTHNIKLADLARSIDVSKSSIARWDKSVPRGDTLIALADFFHVSPDCLLDKSNGIDGTEETKSDEEIFKEEIMELLDLLHLSSSSYGLAKDLLISIKKNEGYKLRIQKAEKTGD